MVIERDQFLKTLLAHSAQWVQPVSGLKCEAPPGPGSRRGPPSVKYALFCGNALCTWVIPVTSPPYPCHAMPSMNSLAAGSLSSAMARPHRSKLWSRIQILVGQFALRNSGPRNFLTYKISSSSAHRQEG